MINRAETSHQTIQRQKVLVHTQIVVQTHWQTALHFFLRKPAIPFRVIHTGHAGDFEGEPRQFDQLRAGKRAPAQPEQGPAPSGRRRRRHGANRHQRRDSARLHGQGRGVSEPGVEHVVGEQGSELNAGKVDPGQREGPAKGHDQCGECAVTTAGDDVLDDGKGDGWGIEVGHGGQQANPFVQGGGEDLIARAVKVLVCFLDPFGFARD